MAQMNAPVPSEFLSRSAVIDWDDPAVLAKAKELASGSGDEMETARNCYLFVRDEILHSADHRMNPVTLSASDVLRHGTGFCFAKSHLLAALLRANGIPAGMCYQRLRYEKAESGFCLHGLNAVYLEGHGWYRADARGNKSSVHADFDPPTEKLAFRMRHPGEADLPGIFSRPLPCVVKVLTESSDHEEVLKNIPDIEVAKIVDGKFCL